MFDISNWIRNFKRAYRQSSIIFIVCWLITVYGIAGWLVLGTLSSYLIQNKISTNKDLVDKNYTISRVMRIHENITREKSNAEKVIARNNKLFFKLEDMNLRLGRLKKQSQFNDVEAELNNSIEAEYLQSDIEILQKTKERFLILIKKYQGQYASYLKKHEITLDILHELSFMKRFKFELLVTMPTELLTLILTISMGALGSIIFLTKEFFNYEEESLSWYFFRPFLGMITALVIYILSKSGLSMMASQSTNPDPFFMSFLAIVSGLFSEHAYEKIEEVGKKIFATEKKKKLEQWEIDMLNWENHHSIKKTSNPASDKEINKFLKNME